MFLCFPGLAQWGGNQAVDWLYCQLGYLLFAHCKERCVRNKRLDWCESDSTRTCDKSEGKGSTVLFASSSLTVLFSVCVCLTLLKTESEKIQ